ncbi:PAS domain S-box protein [Phenylobacterium sp.]|uniref:PAS domain S-box protein n=1 Tax=Phenylobacterium sp. TaxID=1871053 RepID=UPI00286B64C6|nr:PAS domain S-box protein [Phenylobacterium sp.]
MADIEADRLQALRSHGVLDTQAEGRFDRITALAADLFGMPISLVSLVDEERQWFKSHHGLDARETPRSWAFCDHAIRGGPDTVLVVPDATADPRFAGNPLVTGAPDIRFYAGATLATAQGHCLGTLCLIDTKPRTGLSEEEARRFKMLARLAMDELEVSRAIREAEERQRLLSMAEAMSGVGHWRVSPDGVVEWSDEVYRIHGVDRATFNPNVDSGVGFYLPQDQAAVARFVERALSHQEDFAFQLQLMRADGELRHVVCKAVCELTPTGETAAIIGVFQDLTDQVRDVERVKRGEARYRLLADNMGDVITRIGLDGSSNYISPAIEGLLGFTPQEMRGKPAQAFVSPEDHPLILEAFAELGAGLDRKTVQHRATHKDGRTIWVETQFKMVRGEDQRPAAIVAVIRDASARHAAQEALAESEHRHRLIAESATDIISRMGIDGRVRYFSPSVTAVTGYPVAQVTGASMIPLLHPDDVAPALAVYRDLIGGTPLREPLTYRVRHQDGSWIWLEGTPILVRDADGAPSEVIDVRRDITAKVRLEAELRAAKTAAEDAAQVKSAFMANMSHEIRTPLTAIVGFTSLLAARADLDAAAQTQIRRVASAGQALLSIVNDVLDFSKLEAGQVEITPRPTAPGEALAEALDLFSPQAEAKGLALAFVTEGDLPAGLLIDADRVRQILMNLVGNAIKFTDTGEVRVVAAYNAPAYVGGAGRLEIRVEDTGPGLTRAQTRRLFQRFSQVDASSTRRHGGTGLGLAICKGLVEAMGGEIGVRSRPGQGSVFHFTIAAPIADLAVAAPVGGDESLLDGARVLVVDDNAVNRELARAILSRIGVEVSEASDGLAAVEAAATTPFDAVLMDIRMPGLDGPAAVARIRAADGPNRDTPVLAFSADVDMAQFEGAASVFDGLVRKPISPHELVTALSRCLRWDAAEVSTPDAAAG